MSKRSKLGSKPAPEPQVGKVIPCEGLPPGWECVEKVYLSGGHAGQTYVRFQCQKHKSVCSIRKVIAIQAEEDGRDPEVALKEYDAAKKAIQDQKHKEREEKGFVEGPRKLEAIEAFKNKYGKLDGATIANLPGWRGESKILETCGQISARYYAPDGTVYSLVNQVEALFGFKILNGLEHELPDVEAARATLKKDEKGNVINTARRENIVDELSIAPKKPKKNPLEVRVARTVDYRPSQYLRVLRLLGDDMSVLLQEQGVPDQEEVESATAKIQQLLAERGFSVLDTDLVYVTGARNLRTPGKRLLDALSGIYYKMAELVNARPVYQKVFLTDAGQLACSGCYISWSSHTRMWKIGNLANDRAGLAICRQEVADPSALEVEWEIYEPKLFDKGENDEERAEGAVAAE
mmetsp:Transcript_63807/g.185038  ORF Transcript_63807/g.185038 Transcript_63807/m.185038 type:complete len:407 (-) Transcript_63807:117-1337(-)